MERWKSISGYEGYYEVSDQGRVRSLDREVQRSDGVIQMRRGKIKALTADKDGYMTVSLSKNGQTIRHKVHVLVGRAFIRGWFDGAEIDHVDACKSNNSASNLRWVSHRENIGHAIDMRRHVSCRDITGTNNPNYGNHSLSERYASDKHFAKEKQGRPGARNGRAVPVAMIIKDEILHFGCATECANHLIKEHLSHSTNTAWVATSVVRAARAGEAYCGIRFLLD